MLRIYTVGHSTHPIGRFIELLQLHNIGCLADVRSFPGSRRCPQFNQEFLNTALENAVIVYRWIQELGGRRHGLGADSPNQAWEHPAFRSYADYALTEPFQAGLESVADAVSQGLVALMCSEGLWWRCHRRIVADYLLAAGYCVIHIMPGGETVEHKFTDFAVREHSSRILYPATSQNRRAQLGVRS